MDGGRGEVHFGSLLLLAEHFAFVALLLPLQLARRRSPLLSGTCVATPPSIPHPIALQLAGASPSRPGGVEGARPLLGSREAGALRKGPVGNSSKGLRGSLEFAGLASQSQGSPRLSGGFWQLKCHRRRLEEEKERI